MKKEYVHIMEESFLDVITDSALNERFDKIILQDAKYLQLQEKIENLSGEYDALTLLDEQKLIINKLIDSYMEIGTYFAYATYRQGFKDCGNLFKEICM